MRIITKIFNKNKINPILLKQEPYLEYLQKLSNKGQNRLPVSSGGFHWKTQDPKLVKLIDNNFRPEVNEFGGITSNQKYKVPDVKFIYREDSDYKSSSFDAMPVYHSVCVGGIMAATRCFVESKSYSELKTNTNLKPPLFITEGLEYGAERGSARYIAPDRSQSMRFFQQNIGIFGADRFSAVNLGWEIIKRMLFTPKLPEVLEDPYFFPVDVNIDELCGSLENLSDTMLFSFNFEALAWDFLNIKNSKENLDKDALSKKAFASDNMIKSFDANYGKIYDQNGVMIINLHPLLEDSYQKLRTVYCKRSFGKDWFWKQDYEVLEESYSLDLDLPGVSSVWQTNVGGVLRSDFWDKFLGQIKTFGADVESGFILKEIIIDGDSLFGLAFADKLDPTKTRFIKTQNAYLALGATKFTPEVANLITVSGFSALALVEHDLKMPIIIDLHHFVPLAKFKDETGKVVSLLRITTGGDIGPRESNSGVPITYPLSLIGWGHRIFPDKNFRVIAAKGDCRRVVNSQNSVETITPFYGVNIQSGPGGLGLTRMFNSSV